MLVLPLVSFTCCSSDAQRERLCAELQKRIVRGAGALDLSAGWCLSLWKKFVGWRANSPSLLSLLSPPSLLSLLSPPSLLSLLHSVNEITGPLICLFYHVIISALS